jgi:hypothetical protein
VARRAYTKLASLIDARLLATGLQARAFRKFRRQQASGSTGAIHVIVMPRTLHFLLPCLACVPASVPLVLLANGAAGWELDYLRRAAPGRPLFRIWTLPGSSVPHGDLIDFLLAHEDADFGLLDYDLYLFDHTLFERLAPAAGECALALYGGYSSAMERYYPQTFFLFFNRAVMRDLMARHRVDARVCRKAPRPLRALLEKVGLRDGRFPKDHTRFYDTLQLLFALAFAEGLSVRFLELGDEWGAVHVGGSSIRSHRTKGLPALYINLRFLELADGTLRERYAHLVAPFQGAGEVRARLPATAENRRMLAVVDGLIERLRATAPRAAGNGDGQ